MNFTINVFFLLFATHFPIIRDRLLC